MVQATDPKIKKTVQAMIETFEIVNIGSPVKGIEQASFATGIK